MKLSPLTDGEQKANLDKEATLAAHGHRVWWWTVRREPTILCGPAQVIASLCARLGGKKTAKKLAKKAIEAIPCEWC